ncbi:hypothetical protein CYLTODRAFT_493683 [Cylindrobasidium torrendii FP15055 ss-10]|uniref:Uncharacterized protein n=1 Tax=Cylindrobasidium torrendii FP15055 ss-10 TaxID=1314674 RepID=A0A0D7B2I5_9AGAR|nr:hypothetical protein CYLTODRAFT_493683 [Cylindrobasidium torrendii FP15055 ss-10]
MSSSKDIKSIEDWDTYVGASRKGEKPLGKAVRRSNVKSLFESVLDRKGQVSGDPSQLRLAFQVWRASLDDKKSSSSEPLSMLMVGLGDDFPEDITLSSLTPTDQQVVTRIAPLAKAYGFDLHFAIARLDDTRNVSWRVMSSYYGYESDDDYGCGYPEMSDLHEEGRAESEITLCDVVALDGKPMHCRDRPEDLDEIFISAKLGNASNPHETFEHSGEDGHGYVTYTYTNCVLVMTPRENAEDFVAGDLCPWACTRLLASTSSAPTPKEVGLAKLLLKHLSSPKISSDRRVEVVKALRYAAERWNNVVLFDQACRTCGIERCLEAMSVEGMVSACQTFDWASLSPILTEVYKQSTSNVSRHELTVALLKCAAELEDTEMAEWCRTQSGSALDAIQQLDTQDVPWAAAILHSKKNPVVYARDKLFPQLIRLQPQKLSVWQSLFAAVLDSARPKAEIKAMAKIVRLTLCRLADAVPAYPSTKPLYGTGPHVFTVEPISQFSALCFQCNAPEAVSSIFDRMWQQREQQQEGSEAATSEYHPPSKYYLAVVDFLSPPTEMKPHFSEFYQQAAEVLLSVATVPASKPMTVLKLIQNVTDPIPTLKRTFTADCIRELAKNQDALKTVAETISKDFRPLTIPSTFKSFENVLELFLAELIRTFDIKSASTYYYVPVYAHGVQSATQLIELCLTLEIPTYAGHILTKLLSGPEVNGQEYIQRTLIAILKALPGMLRHHCARVDELPWSAFTAEVLKRYTRHILGAKPPPFAVADHKIKALACGCALCTIHLLPILLNTSASGTIKQTVRVRAHIEKCLAPAKLWGMKWETLTYTSPHTLVIVKPEAMVLAASWNSKKKQACEILALLGDATAQTNALDEDYDWVIGTLEGTCSPPMAPAAEEQVAEVKKRAANASDSSARKRARLS